MRTCLVAMTQSRRSPMACRSTRAETAPPTRDATTTPRARLPTSERETGPTLRLLTGEADEMAALQRVLEHASDYAERLTGAPPGPADAQSLYTVLPPDKTYDDKFVFGVRLGDTMVGCVDLIRGWPDPATAHVGLLLLSASHRRRGIGERVVALLEAWVARWGTCDRLRIGVVRINAEVEGFWRKQGFAPTGEVKPYAYGPVRSKTVVMSKALVRASSASSAAS